MKHVLRIAPVLLAVQSLAAIGISGEYVTTLTQPLPDGNEIRRTAVGTYVQDINGRVQVGVNGHLFTLDPVAGSQWTADPQAGLVHVKILSNDELRVAKRVTEINANLTEDMPDPPDWMPANRDGVVDDLGTRLVNGLNSVGKRITQTIAAGALGNRDPIVLEFETWTSNDFGFPVSVRTVVRDPLSGVQTREIRNIEPLDAEALETHFTIDPAWTLVESNALPSRGAIEILDRK